MKQEIEDRIQRFVADITAIARRAAFEAIQSDLGGAARPATADGAPRKAASPARGRARATSRRAVGGKRDPKEIERTKAAVLAHVAENPGLRVDDIGRALGRSTAELALPIKKLLEGREIKRKGERRGTRYYPS